jgi:TonB-dependent receptor
MVLLVMGRASPGQIAPGGVRGVVTDAEFGGPVPDVSVTLLELNRRVTTDEEGHFILPDLVAGIYTLTFSKPGYATRVSSGVMVAPGSLADLTIRLGGEFSEMEEFVVRDIDLETTTGTEMGLLNLRAATLTFQDSVSKELMSKAGVSDAAAAVKLVVGAAIVDGKYASVRGLSDRYVGAALNGLRVPSSDPRRRAVQLDVFPAGTIDSISVTKTFTPDLPGDYSGGGVNIRLTTIPDEPFFKFSFTRTHYRDYTGKDGFVTYDGAGAGRWGRHNGLRDMPPGAPEMEDNRLTDKGLDSKHEALVDEDHPHSENYLEYDRITKAFAPAMGTKREKAPPNYSYNLSLGGRARQPTGWDLGGVGAFTYATRHRLASIEETEYVRPNEGSPQETNLFNYVRDTGSAETKWSILTGVGMSKEDRQRITLTLMRSRAANDQASVSIEEHDPLTTPYWEQKQAIQYTERSVDTLQLVGDHKWDEFVKEGLGLRLNWFGAHNVVEQDEPDVRQFDNVVVRRIDGDYVYQPRPPGVSGADEDSSTRIWRNTKEDNSQYGLNVTVPFDREFSPSPGLSGAGPNPELREGAFKFGWLNDLTVRNYRQNAFFYTFGNQLTPAYTGPVRSSFPPGRAGQAAYIAARNAWFASPAGEAYQKGVQATAEDAGKYLLVTNSPNALWTDVFTQPDRLGVGDWQNSIYTYAVPKFYDVTYEGDQQLPSGYWMIDLPLVPRLRLTIGARVEDTYMRVDPRSDLEELDPGRAFQVPVRNPIVNPGGSTNYYYTIAGVSREEATVELDEYHWLRSAGLVYDLTPTMKLRYNYGQTIARPTFLEIAPVITFDYIEGEAVIGNKDLVLSTIDNYDLRWEWFRKPDQIFAVSWFYKDIVNPIDKESFGYLGQDYVLSVNYPRGRVRGAEFEFRTPLGAPPFMPGRFTLGANYTMIDATVEIPDNLQNDLAFHTIAQDERDMEGQPANLSNVNLTYEFGYGTAISLFYNRRGDMLKTGASIGEEGATPNIYTLARATMDLGISQKIGRALNAAFRIKNMLNQPVEEVYRLPDGYEIPRRSYKESIEYSFTFGGSW